MQGRRFRFSALWQMQLAALAIGVMLQSTLDPLAGQVGATLIAITNLFQVAFLWFVSYDVARHRDLPSYVILGFFWLLHLFFRESGRLVMWWVGGSGGTEMMLVIAVMICLIAVSVGFLLTDAMPRKRPLFAELCQCSKAITATEREQDVVPVNQAVGVVSQEESLREQFGLTQRETEVALLLAEGRSSTYIAGELYLSDNTVRSYVKNIYQKLDVHSKQDLIDFMKGR